MKHPYKFVALAAVVAALAILAGSTGAQAAGPNADSIAVDLDTTGNTETTLGTRDECREVNAGDTLDIDVTVAGVPAGDTAMIGFTYALGYDAGVISITGYNDHNNSGFLSTAVGYSPFADIDAVPVGFLAVNMLDISADGASGSGYLHRLSIQVAAEADPGGYAIPLSSNSNYLDKISETHFPDAIFGARLAVGVTCASLPTRIANVLGDVDCSDSAKPVSATDALKVLRYVAKLSVTQPATCTPIGHMGTGEPLVQGDVDCKYGATPVNATDALKILRKIAKLNVSQDPGCPQIGT